MLIRCPSFAPKKLVYEQRLRTRPLNHHSKLGVDPVGDFNMFQRLWQILDNRPIFKGKHKEYEVSPILDFTIGYHGYLNRNGMKRDDIGPLGSPWLLAWFISVPQSQHGGMGIHPTMSESWDVNGFDRYLQILHYIPRIFLAACTSLDRGTSSPGLVLRKEPTNPYRWNRAPGQLELGFGLWPWAGLSTNGGAPIAGWFKRDRSQSKMDDN